MLKLLNLTGRYCINTCTFIFLQCAIFKCDVFYQINLLKYNSSFGIYLQPFKMHDYEQYTVPQLKQICKDRQIACRNLKKQDIICLLKEKDASGDSKNTCDELSKTSYQEEESERLDTDSDKIRARKERFGDFSNINEDEEAKIKARRARFGQDIDQEKIEARKKRFNNK